jgi:hypothetical protein
MLTHGLTGAADVNLAGPHNIGLISAGFICSGVTGLNAAIFADPQGVLVAFVARPRRATRVEHTNEIGLLN